MHNPYLMCLLKMLTFYVFRETGDDLLAHKTTIDLRYLPKSD